VRQEFEKGDAVETHQADGTFVDLTPARVEIAVQKTPRRHPCQHIGTVSRRILVSKTGSVLKMMDTTSKPA
jgi:hypothetical protein